jgi:hypothetical protein
MDAIQHGHLDCSTLFLRKWHPDASDGFGREFFIRHHMDEVDECVSGDRFHRKLLRWARIERWAMHEWCERQGVPLPEFWFPPGWNIDYRWPDDDDPEPPNPSEPVAEQRIRMDKWHRIQMACQQVALWIWAKEPNLTIKEVAWRKEVQEQAGGSEVELETVERWIGKVDRRNPSKKRGRKRKNNPPFGETEQ